MTREAIERLKHMKVFIGYDAESPIVKEMQSALDMAIKAIEQTRWIPCSEKNPDRTGEYLTTIKWFNCENTYSYMVVKRDYYAEVETWNDSLVIAWMPLPQPYTESEDAE